MADIPHELWHTCKFCGKDFSKILCPKGKYRATLFKEHIEQEHNCSMNDYFDDLRYICPCKICGKKCEVLNPRGKTIKIQEYACHRTHKSHWWWEKMKEEFKGEKSCRYGVAPTNKGKKTPEDVRLKQSIAARKRKPNRPKGSKHIEESKNKMRLATLEMIKRGAFKHTKTKPHLLFLEILKELNVKYIEEYKVAFWLFDFYIEDFNCLIEVDGDYFHSNPKIYPNGPKTKTQVNNAGRDKNKNNYCKKNNINLIRFWESDILNNPEEIKCKLREYFMLEKLEKQEL